MNLWVGSLTKGRQIKVPLRIACAAWPVPKALTKDEREGLRNGDPQVHVKWACKEEVSAASTAGCEVASTVPADVVNSTAKMLCPADLFLIAQMRL